jgi:hypothetical protein
MSINALEARLRCGDKTYYHKRYRLKRWEMSVKIVIAYNIKRGYSISISCICYTFKLKGVDVMVKKRKKEKTLMATQFAATPTLTGKDAKRLVQSLNKKPSENSKKNANELISFFQSFEKKGK